MLSKQILLLLLLAPAGVLPFATWRQSLVRRTAPVLKESIRLDTTLDDDKIESLFAWVSRAFAGDRRYNDLSLAIAAVFGDLADGNPLVSMKEEAMELMPPEEESVGAPISREEREHASLGAMGAGQWMGQYRTRPHSLLTVSNFTSVDDWIKPLSRGVRRTLKKAVAQNFTVRHLYIRGGEPSPHSSLAHFRCVVEHEVRVIGGSPYGFFDAVAEGVSRYMGTTRMTGEIREYRDADGKVIAFAHEVRKGGTIRGQWFYGTDQASKNYVWFHSVYDLVRRAIETEGVDVVDLGPSGSDAFTDLKEKYGFVPVDDWPAVADYQGPFWYPDEEGKGKGLLDKFLDALDGRK